MSDNIKEFEFGLKAYTEKTVPEEVKALRDAVAMEGLRGLVMLTPYDTGRARGNYQVTAGAPAEGYAPEKFDKTGQVAVASGEEVVAATKDPWAVIWIHNGVPYITYLNDGTAPHEIRPRNARALVFKDAQGNTVITGAVHHPGTPAFHMLEQTVDRLRRRFA